MCMKMEHLVFLDSVSYLPCSLRKMPEAFGLTASKSCYPHYFNTEENLDYVGPIPDASYYGANEKSELERRDFFAWYEIQKRKVLCSITEACWKRIAKMMSRSYGNSADCLDESLSSSIT